MTKHVPVYLLPAFSLLLLLPNPAGSDDPSAIPRAVTCEMLLAAGVPDAYAAGLLDGVRALEISFRLSVDTLRGEGRQELAERSQFTADAIAERLKHADGQTAEALAGRIRQSCAGDPKGTAELHFVLALEGWRRSQAL